MFCRARVIARVQERRALHKWPLSKRTAPPLPSPRRFATGDQPPSRWSHVSSILLSGVAGVALGVATYFAVEYFTSTGDKGAPSSQEDDDLLPEVDANNIEKFLQGPNRQILLEGVKATFETPGGPKMSDELASWLILQVYDKAPQLTPEMLEEVKGFTAAVAKRLPVAVESTTTVPGGHIGLALDETMRPTGELYEAGDHTLSQRTNLFLLNVEEQSRTCSVLVRSAPRDHRLTVMVTFKPKMAGVVDLVRNYGVDYADHIIPALSDTIAEETNAKVKAEEIAASDFAAVFAKELRKEVELLGVDVVDIETTVEDKFGQ